MLDIPACPLASFFFSTILLLGNKPQAREKISRGFYFHTRAPRFLKRGNRLSVNRLPKYGYFCCLIWATCSIVKIHAKIDLKITDSWKHLCMGTTELLTPGYMGSCSYLDVYSKRTDGKLLLFEISKSSNCSSLGCLKSVQFHNWFRLH